VFFSQTKWGGASVRSEPGGWFAYIGDYQQGEVSKMNNISTPNHTHSSVPAGRARGGLSQPGAQRLLQTSTVLSLLGPRRAAPGGRSKPGRRSGASGDFPGASSVPRQVAVVKKRTEVRVREASGVVQRSADHEAQMRGQDVEVLSLSRSSKKGKKADAAKKRRPAAGRARSGPSAGSRRQQRRSEALDDFVVAPGRRGNAARQEADDHVHQRSRRSASCHGGAIPLGRDNFTRIQDDLDGCYRLVEDAVVVGDQARALPIGNSTHPFTGDLDGAGYGLGVDLRRSQGDALVFGAIANSFISLAVSDSRLETRNGSRAALIGEMQDANRLHITRLHQTRFSASGRGTVAAGLVASTAGSHNAVRLHNATNNQVVATALPPSLFCSQACSQRAAASLGLGTIVSGGHQSIVHTEVARNDLYAWAAFNRSGSLEVVPHPGHGTAHATVGALGLLGDPRGAQVRITSVQQRVHANSLVASAAQLWSDAGTVAVAGHACTSLGYGDLECPPTPVPSRAWLWVWQIDCRANWVLAQSWNASVDAQGQVQGTAAPGGLARASLVSNAAVQTLLVQHRSVAPGQLSAQTQAERALLGPAQEARVRLYSGGDAELPLFARWNGTTHCLASSLIDRAGYQLGDLNCQRQNGSARQPDPMALNSLEPDDWRQLYDSLGFDNFGNFSQVAPGLASVSLPCAAEAGLHYPHETVQSLIPAGDEWLLVTRQRYPFRQENDLKGLLRVRHFQLPDPPGVPRLLPALSEPQSTAGLVYQPPAGAVLTGGLPVHALVQDLQLHLLYQGPGQPAQVVSLSLQDFSATGPISRHYQLTEYDAPAGQARLLSEEDNALHLWVQQDDKVQAVNLESSTDSSRRLLFDLSGQPGGSALLARDGRWLYSLRQEEGEPASLRRFKPGSAGMDPCLQTLWEGAVPNASRLSLDSDGRLRLVPLGALADPRDSGLRLCGRPGEACAPDPRARDYGLQLVVPPEGGCARWENTWLISQSVPCAEGATASGSNDNKDRTSLPPGAVITLFIWAGLCALGGSFGSAACIVARCRARPGQLQPEGNDQRPAGGLMAMSRHPVHEEIPVRDSELPGGRRLTGPGSDLLRPCPAVSPGSSRSPESGQQQEGTFVCVSHSKEVGREKADPEESAVRP